MSEATIYKVLKNVVGPENVSDEPAICWAYSADASLMEPTPPSIVIRPGSAEEVSKIVKLANIYKVPVIPSGGRSSLCHAGVPALGGGILIDMTRMKKIRIHEDKRLVTVEAGCTCSRLNEELNREGLTTGTPGPIGAFSATIGGSLSVGMFSITGAPIYGPFAERVTGIEVVLPNGDIIRTGAGANPSNEMVCRYCNGGDFTGLFLCTHGALGIITKATLKIHPKPESEAYVDYVFDDLEKASQAAIKILNTGYAEIIHIMDKWIFLPFGISPAPDALLMVSVCGPREDISKRKEMVEKTMTECGGKPLPNEWKPMVFTTAEFFRRSGAYMEGPTRWAEFAGYIPLYRTVEFFRASEKFIDDHMVAITKYNIIPMLGALYTPYCVNYYGMFNIAPPHTEEKASAADHLKEEHWGKLVEMGAAPYWIGMSQSGPLPWRLGPYYKLFKLIKEALDPNNIMNPGMLHISSI